MSTRPTNPNTAPAVAASLRLFSKHLGDLMEELSAFASAVESAGEDPAFLRQAAHDLRTLCTHRPFTVLAEVRDHA